MKFRGGGFTARQPLPQTVLGQGQIPPGLPERMVDEWIAAEMNEGG